MTGTQHCHHRGSSCCSTFHPSGWWPCSAGFPQNHKVAAVILCVTSRHKAQRKKRGSLLPFLCGCGCLVAELKSFGTIPFMSLWPELRTCTALNQQVAKRIRRPQLTWRPIIWGGEDVRKPNQTPLRSLLPLLLTTPTLLLVVSAYV